MIIIAKIHGLIGKIDGGISGELLEELCAIYPEGRSGNQGHVFESALPIDDERTKKILELLQESGLRPWENRSRMPIRGQEFSLDLERKYSTDDLEECNYLELAPTNKAKGMYRTDRQRGRIIMESPAKGPLGYVFVWTWCIIRNDFKEILESYRFKHIEFLQVEKRYESMDFDLYDEEDKWWELRSRLILPPVSTSVMLVTKGHQPFTGDFSKGCYRQEGLFRHPELHYAQSDIEMIEPFDLAHTFEGFGGLPDEFDRPLVASKRFYDICVKHKIKTGWVPVRLDD